MSESERTQSRKRLADIEAEIATLREPLEKTLMDVRELLAGIENPLNNTPFKETTRIAVAEEQKARKENNREKEIGVTTNELKASYERNGSSASKLMNSAACASLLLSMLGRSEAEALIHRVAGNRGAQVVEEMWRALEYLGHSYHELLVKSSRQTKVSRTDSILLGINILNMYLRDPYDPLLAPLAMLLNHILASNSELYGE